jgi:lysosome membrane protein 2
MLHGTDGVFFTPLMDKNYPIWLFVSDLCRSVYATYESETEVIL